MPDFSTLSRRQKNLKFHIPYRGSAGPLHLLIDCTGIKVEGEGEWNARKHGGSKRRVWRKIHIGIDEQTLEIWAAELTTSDVGDAPMLPELLDQIPLDQEIASVTADGAFTPESATTPYIARQWFACKPRERPSEELPPSYRPARTPSPGSPIRREQSPVMKPCAYHAASVEPPGDDGAVTTGEAASSPRCTVSNCSASE